MAFNMTPALPSEPMSTVTPGPSSEAMTILNVRDAGVTELTTLMSTMQQTSKSCEFLLKNLP